MAIGVIGSVLLVILGYFTQIAVFPALGAIAVGPNVILALAVVFAMVYGPWPALATGFFGGMMVDFIAGGAIGISSFVPVLVGFLLGFFRGKVNSGHFIWAMVFSAVAYIINDFWIIITMYFARITINISWGTFLRSIASAVETGIAAAVIFLILSKLIAIGEKRSGLPYLQRYNR